MHSKKKCLQKSVIFAFVFTLIYLFMFTYNKQIISSLILNTKTKYNDAKQMILSVSNNVERNEMSEYVTQMNVPTSDSVVLLRTLSESGRSLTTKRDFTVDGGTNVDTATDNNVEDDRVLSAATLEKLKILLGCFNKDYETKTKQRGDYWVFYNFVRAEHGPLACHQDVTFLTHGDLTYLQHLEMLIKRWNGPLAVSLFAPGDDMLPTVETIHYLRDCSPALFLIKKWVTFHLYFHKDHLPETVPNVTAILSEQFNCSLPPPYLTNSSALFKSRNNLLYPVNVGRNIAIEAALTHYFLSLDIELYPTPNLGARFLNMLARNKTLIRGERPRVFIVIPFEVEKDQQVPTNKTQLQTLLRKKKAIPFHHSMCSQCHEPPHMSEWLATNETDDLRVLGIGKRVGKYKSWEPLFICTHNEPLYDERLSWDGKRDKMTQSYVLCVKDYDFYILDNTFVTHHPGIKHYVVDHKRENIAARQSSLIDNTIAKELHLFYGTRDGCKV